MLMHNHPYYGVFQLIFWFTPVLICYAFRKSPAKYKLPKCYFQLFLASIPVYILITLIFLSFSMSFTGKDDILFSSNKYTPIFMIIVYIFSVSLAFIRCKINFKEESKELEFQLEPKQARELIKNSKLLALVSIILLGIGIYAWSNMFIFGFVVVSPALGILFFLHFKPQIIEFVGANICFFLTVCIVFFFLMSLVSSTNYNQYLGIALFFTCPLASLASILLHDSYLISGRKYFSTKYSYLLVLLVVLPFLFVDPFFSFLPASFINKIINVQFHFPFWKNIPAYANIILIIIGASFSYYWFLKLKKNILTDKAELELQLNTEVLPECASNVPVQNICGSTESRPPSENPLEPYH